MKNYKTSYQQLYQEFDFQYNGVIQQFLFNIIDCLKLPNFYFEAILSDGVLIAVDYMEGISASTESILSVIMKEKVKPVLMANKLDRTILEL